MTQCACGARIVRLMTTDAARHCQDRGGLGQGIELLDVPMAHHALHAGLQMSTVRPSHSRRELINAQPANRFRDCRVAPNTGAGSGKRHLCAGIGIDVALLALEPLCHVRFVAEWKGLLRRRMRCRVIRHLLFGGPLLRTRTEREKQQGDESHGPHHDFLLPTSSMLVPKSLNIAAAAFRPGKPVMEPPGGVHAPVW